MTPMSVFGKYLSKMKLKQWNMYSWKDTEALRAEADRKAAEAAAEQEARTEEIKKAYENGELTEEQYQSYQEAIKPEQSFEIGFAPGGSTEIFEAGTAPFEKVDLVDVGADLTDEDKIYLAMKWGQLYTAAEWVSLEQKYHEFKDSFDVQDAAREDQLMFICKTSLKMNQALDAGDIDSYQKLSKVYDSHMKAGKFTEAQKKEENKKEFDSIGEIVLFCEKESGFIPEHEITTPFDIADKDIINMKKYNESLIKEDPTVFK